MSLTAANKVKPTGGTLTASIPMNGVRVALRSNAACEVSARTWGIQCENCGRSVRRELHKIIRSNHHYCSQSCRSEAHKVDWECVICGRKERKIKSRAADSSACNTPECRLARRRLSSLLAAQRERQKDPEIYAPFSGLNDRMDPVGVSINTLARKNEMSKDAVKVRLSRRIPLDTAPSTNKCRARGRSIKFSKFNEAQVLSIFRRLRAGEKRQPLADEYGVTYRSIKLIDTGETWGWLTSEYQKAAGQS